MRLKKVTNKRAFTLMELTITIAMATIVIFTTGAVLVESQRGTSSVHQNRGLRTRKSSPFKKLLKVRPTIPRTKFFFSALFSHCCGLTPPRVPPQRGGMVSPQQLLQFRRLAIALQNSVRSRSSKLSSMREQTHLSSLNIGQAYARWPIRADESAF